MNRTGLTTRDRLRGQRVGEPRPERRRSTARRDASGARRQRAAGRARTSSTRVTPLRTRRRSRYRRPLLAAAALLAVAGLVAFLWAGPLFAVREVRVDGLVTLPADQVQQAAGIEPDTPLLEVDVDAAEVRVAGLPQVASVEVTRGWPSSVVITVVERTPVAVVEDAGLRTLVDGEGVLFDTISGAPPEGVMPLEVSDPGPDDPATAAALTAIDALPDEVRARVVGVLADSAPVAVSMRLDDGTVVRWGDGQEPAEKAAVLTALLQQIESGGLEPAGELDVSTPGAVVLR